VLGVMFSNPSAAEVSRRPTGLHQGPEETGMEQLDPEDGLAVWDFTEGSELPGGNLAVERLGVGGSGETWLVWNPGLWSPAVMKLALPHEVRPQRAIQALCRETAALAGNLHPGLPRLLADGTSDPVPHILIEYIDGPALDDELAENGAIGAEEAALLGAQLLPALASLHDRGLAHLDVKSANTTADVLVALADAAGEFRPWPAWLDRYAAVSQPVP
jgi:eukaryotic-like serine/threonine-protein kinase